MFAMITDEKIKRITRSVINEEISKNDVESIVSRKLSSSYDSRDFKKAVKEITAEVIEDLYRTLWNRSSTWKGGITR
jgi:predicted transcriptional regulator